MNKKFYIHPQYKRLYGDKIVTCRVAAAWPALAIPRLPPAMEGQPPGAPRYEATLVINKDDKDAASFLTNLNAMVKEMVLQYNAAAKKDARPQLAIEDSLIDGDSGKFPLDKYPYYKNCWLLIARNTKQPVFKDYKGEAFADGTLFKGGDITRAEITPHLGPTGISFKLEAIQLIKRGTEPMGGGMPNHGELLAEEEDGEVVAPAVRETVEAPMCELSPTEGEYVSGNVQTKAPETEPLVPAELAAAATAAPQVTLTGKNLADKLKSDAAAAVQGQVTQAPKEAKAVPLAAPTLNKSKMAAVDML